MDLTNLIVIILLIICAILWSLNLFKQYPEMNAEQQPIKVMYIYKPELDLQFNKSNFPSKLYDNLFTGENVYQGGYHMDQGRTMLTSSGRQP